MANDDWAIVVGVSKYPEIGDLNGPGNDATDFYDWVISPSGGYVPPRQAKKILSSDYPPSNKAIDAEPTPIRVQRAFEELQEMAEKNSLAGEGLRVGRRLFIYLAGHGFAPAFEEACLLMANATRLRVGHNIPGIPYANWFFRSGYFEEVALFMDCCRESYPKTWLNLPPYIDVTDPGAILHGKRFYGFRTKWSRISYERPMSDGKVHGVFTTALLAGLKGAAADNTGQITAGSLGDYLYNNMKNFLAPEDLVNPDIPKEPDLDYDKNPAGNIVFATVSVNRYTVTFHLPVGAVGKKIEVLGDKFVKIAETVATSATWQQQLVRGMYLFQVVGNGSSKVFEVSGEGDIDVG
jgi:hypothetical protein